MVDDYKGISLKFFCKAEYHKETLLEFVARIKEYHTKTPKIVYNMAISQVSI